MNSECPTCGRPTFWCQPEERCKCDDSFLPPPPGYVYKNTGKVIEIEKKQKETKKKMKRTISNNHLRFQFTPSMAGLKTVFINLWGNSSSAILTEKSALNTAKMLRETADWLEEIAPQVGEKA